MNSAARRTFLTGSLGAVALGAASATGGSATAAPADTGLPRAVYEAFARTPECLFVGAVSRNMHGAVTSAAVVWPDGTPGTYTAEVVSAKFPGAVDAYHITYGDPVRLTYTQPAVTRSATGAVVHYPQVEVQ